jgi:hypothetical protein
VITPRSAAFCVVIALTLFGASEARAQESARSFEQLRQRLNAGDTVVLADSGGVSRTGTVTEVTASSLRLLLDGHARDFAQDDVLWIDRRTSDSVLNGLAIGAAIGAALFLKYYADNALCQVNCQFRSGALGMIAIGAAAGWGVDALVTKRVPIFRRDHATPSWHP